MTDLPGRPAVVVAHDGHADAAYEAVRTGFAVTLAPDLRTALVDTDAGAGVVVLDARGESTPGPSRLAVDNPDWWRVVLVTETAATPAPDGPIDEAVSTPVDPDAFVNLVERLAAEALAAVRSYERSSLQVERNVVAAEAEADKPDQAAITEMRAKVERLDARLAELDAEITAIHAVSDG
jgi:hypothetical protein